MIEICILAGGLSSRIGRDKARLRWRGRTLLRHVRDAAEATGWPVRVIRKDIVPRCGPLGGIYTALSTTKAARVLFLACDMPLVTPALLYALIDRKGTVFTRHDRATLGFPFILRREELALVQRLISQKKHSLQGLARVCGARVFIGKFEKIALLNVNTPQDWELLQNSQFTSVSVAPFVLKREHDEKQR